MTVSSCLPPVDGSSSDDEPLSLLDRLPDDSLHHLLTFVDARSLASFACVSRGAAALAQLPSLWHRYVADQFSLAESPLARISPRDVRHLLQRQPNRRAYQIGGSSVISGISGISVASGPSIVDQLTARYIGELGGDRAVRCDPPLPTAPYAALRAVSDDEYAVLRECDVSYFEVTIGEPPARDDDFVPQPECVAVGLASAKVRAQIRRSLSAPPAR
jgi:hypothetical protein